MNLIFLAILVLITTFLGLWLMSWFVKKVDKPAGASRPARRMKTRRQA